MQIWYQLGFALKNLADTNKENTKLRNHLKQKEFKVDQLSQLLTNKEPGMSKNQKKKASKYNTVYKKLLEKLQNSISESLLCPLSLEPIEVPTICPSGHTIDEFFMKKLVKDNKRDPFNNLDICDKVIINRFAINMKEVLKEVNNLESILLKEKGFE
mmetsp:Transcript_27755/g.24548  ORF Transcript_27755/g.24548 Transcript_27755/m.24548 type:complete len:157 (+) Transcript_27755:559-1029(+)